MARAWKYQCINQTLIWAYEPNLNLGRVEFTGSCKGMEVSVYNQTLIWAYEPNLNLGRVEFTGSGKGIVVSVYKPNPNLGDRGLQAVARAW